jgi:DNA-binding beta-propeller fold protein YncE
MQGRVSTVFLLLLIQIASWLLLPATAFNEVRAFLDEYGRLHYGDQIFVVEPFEPAVDKTANCFGYGCEQPSGSGSGSPERAVGCLAGTEVNVSYGDLQRTALLPATLQDGQQSLISCAEVFEMEAWGGPIVLNCTEGSLSAEMQCGCAHQPVDRPVVKMEKWMSIQGPPPSVPCAKERFLKEFQEVKAKPKTGVVWPRAELIEEGQVEYRSCAELGPVQSPESLWTLQCFEGRIITMSANCGFIEGEESAPSRLLTEENATNPLAHIPACEPAPTDEWWPSICASLAHQTKATVAGAYSNESAEGYYLTDPAGVAVDHVGHTIVADTVNQRIMQWAETTWAVGSGGTVVLGVTDDPGDYNSDSKFNRPSDVVINGCRDLYIADTYNNRIVAHRPGYPTMFIAVGEPTAGTGNTYLNNPMGVFVDPSDTSIYVADTGNHRILKFILVQPYGNWIWQAILLGMTGEPGDALNRFNYPHDVYLDLTDNVYVADTMNNRILKFLLSEIVVGVGESLGTVVGDQTGCLQPTSVHVDDANSVYAACRGSHCIRKWPYSFETSSYLAMEVVAGICDDPIAAPWSNEPDYGTSITRLNHPEGVFVDVYGSIIVSDTGNNRVLKYGKDQLSQWIIRNSEFVDFD